MAASVSCLMPVSLGRRDMALAAIECWQAQSYAGSELVIADWHGELAGAVLPAGVRVVDRPDGPEHGPQLRALVQGAVGEICVRWDDDDWQGPGRVAAAVDVLSRRKEDCAAYVISPWLDLRTGEVLRPRWLWAGNGFSFRRAAWERLCCGPGQDPFTFRGPPAPIGGNDAGAHLWGVLHGRNYLVTRARFAPWRGQVPAVPAGLRAALTRAA